MSFTINSLVMKVFLPIIVGVAIMGTLNSINQESLGPQVDSVQDALGEFDRTFVLMDSTEDDNLDLTREAKARHEFRQAVIFNMFTAQHCSFLPYLEEMDRNTDFSKLERGEVFYPQIQSDDIKVFEVLKKEDEMSLTCAGAGNVFEQVPTGPGAFMPDVLGESGSESETEGTGNDMEGIYGRINYEVNETFRLEDPRVGGTNFDDIGSETARAELPDLWRGDRMVSMLPAGMTYNWNKCKGGVFQNEEVGARTDLSMYEGETTSGWKSTVETAIQESIVGEVGSVLGLDEALPDYVKVINHYGGETEGLYAYRVRMSDIPMFKPGAMAEDSASLTLCGLRETGGGTMKKFLLGEVPYNEYRSNVEYVMCEGSSGYIQSNAGGLEQEAEAAGTIGSGFFEGNAEAVVFPVVQATDQEDCLRSGYKFFNYFDDDAARKIISPRIDFGDDGQREACSFEEVRQMRNETWKVNEEGDEIKVGCALTMKEVKQSAVDSQRPLSYYTSVWYARDDTCEVQDADITEFFHASGDYVNEDTSGWNSKLDLQVPGEIYTEEEGLIMKDGPGWVTATYDMSYNTDIDEISIDNFIYESKSRIILYPVDSEQNDRMKLVYSSRFTGDTSITTSTKWRVEMSDETYDNTDVNMDANNEDYSQISIDLDSNSLDWDTHDKNFNLQIDDMPDKVRKIEVRSNRGGTNPVNPGTTIINELTVTGDLC